VPLAFPLSPGPISGSLGQTLDCEKLRSAHFPTSSRGALKDQLTFGHLRTLRAAVVD
jgi:hypothetical protein